MIRKRWLLAGVFAGACLTLAAAAMLVVRAHTAAATTATLVAPNGVRCMDFVAGVEPGYSCIEREPGTSGVRCSGYVAPAGEIGLNAPRTDAPPTSYLVRDVGAPGVPALSSAERDAVRRIATHHASATLRFTFLASSVRNDSFVVFDAVNGPCFDAAGGYPVLNGDPQSRRFYEPGENPYVLLSAPE